MNLMFSPIQCSCAQTQHELIHMCYLTNRNTIVKSTFFLLVTNLSFITLHKHIINSYWRTMMQEVLSVLEYIKVCSKRLCCFLTMDFRLKFKIYLFLCASVTLIWIKTILAYYIISQLKLLNALKQNFILCFVMDLWTLLFYNS